MKQRQFLQVVDDDEARRRFDEACAGVVPRAETVRLEEAWGRVLFEDVCAQVDVPGFDRSNMDGFAVRAADTFGAEETDPISLRLSPHAIAAGGDDAGERGPQPGEAVAIATGARLPRGADAVVMVEDTAPARGDEGRLEVFRAVAPGANVAGAGSDIGRGEVVLRRGRELGSRETALIAAVGLAEVPVFARPRVAVLSTGDEVRPPGVELAVGEIYDSNSRIISDAVRELGGEPDFLGIVGDDETKLESTLRPALEGPRAADIVLLSGGTSKGAGDLNYRVVEKLARGDTASPGILVHGVALKPGKPLCLAVVANRPLAILPGFPTSAIFTFHEFVAPLLRRLSGRRSERSEPVEARAPLRIPSATGRTEYVLVDLVPGRDGLAAYPLGAGSGSVSTFSAADGFVRIDRHREYVGEGERVLVQPIGERVRPADLIAIGSHCVGLDRVLGRLSDDGYQVKSILVGSQAGLAALARGEGDIAGTHLLDEETGIYNRAFLPPSCRIIGGWTRRQGIVFRHGDARFEGHDLEELAAVVHQPGVRMANRNRGSGTRVLLDAFLARGGTGTPEGYHAQARSHHAVAAAVAQGRADWGITLDTLAREAGLAFVFLQDERYELAARDAQLDRPAVRALTTLLRRQSFSS